MTKSTFARAVLYGYVALFLAYMLLPLVVTAGAAFNDSRFPSVIPWRGATLRWFVDFWHDEQMWRAIRNTIWVGLTVVVLALPLGTAGALLITSVSGKLRILCYGLMVAPMLTPGAVIGIATLLFWANYGVSAGLHLSVLGQTSYIATFVMLLVLARLQSFDRALEEAALDLGATHGQVIRRILLPHLMPALVGGAVVAFFQSVENFNVTLFTRGNSDTLMVYVGSKVRTGITPTINALAVVLIAIAVLGALAYELKRRSVERRIRADERKARQAELIETRG